ncbi:hypothetical protein GCM10009609_38740 [Pseudonocardia aurantiaca]|uniref:Uncharacterized protein n=1 Tax=Pseudonocardia aurantiaca TaxID=75290 RepID=A0ABW4FMM7_9PSEU
MTTHIRVASLALGPALLAASTFFWQDGRYGVTGGVLVALSSAAWIYGLLGVWEHLHAWLPKLAAVGLLMTLLGTFGGIAFGLQGFFEGIFGVSGPESLAAADEYPTASLLVLWGPGSMFPLSLVLLGAVLFRTAIVPRLLAVAFMLGGAAFPATRIGRIDLIAHTADALLLGASIWLSVLIAKGLLDSVANPEPVLHR